MALTGEYEPSPRKWVRDQVELYERTDGQQGNILRDTGMPVVIFTMRGRKSGKIRKVPLMRVEHDGAYAMVASQGGSEKHPVWYRNVMADPEALTVQDGPERFAARARELQGVERTEWWERAVATYPPYADYQRRTDRLIPVLLAERRS